MEKRNINAEYFKDIDCSKKAYWLGFIAADGYLNEKYHKLIFCIKDLEILERFNKDTNSNYQISPLSRFDKRTNKTYSEYSLQIYNKEFYKNILQWIPTNKTDVFSFPNIKEEYYPDFIAGLFDGDGSIFIRNTKYPTLGINLISTKEVLEYIQEILKVKFNIAPLVFSKVTENKSNVYKMYLYKDAVKFLEYIYCRDADMYLSRKYNRYIKYKNNKPSRNRNQPVLQYSINGELIKEFPNLKIAAESINKKNSNLIESYKRRIKSGGFYWIYKNGIVYNKIDINQWKNNGIVQEVV